MKPPRPEFRQVPGRFGCSLWLDNPRSPVITSSRNLYLELDSNALTDRGFLEVYL